MIHHDNFSKKRKKKKHVWYMFFAHICPRPDLQVFKLMPWNPSESPCCTWKKVISWGLYWLEADFEWSKLTRLSSGVFLFCKVCMKRIGTMYEMSLRPSLLYSVGNLLAIILDVPSCLCMQKPCWPAEVSPMRSETHARQVPHQMSCHVTNHMRA
jgi:hypothetical protein